jgi:aspartate ammonia-lyase
MKLLPPTEARKLNKSQTDAHTAQIELLESTLKRLQDRINQENTAFEARMTEQRDLYGAERARLQIEVTGLENNIQELARQRKALLVPVEDLKQQAQQMLAEVELKRTELDAALATTEKLKRDAVEKLDDVLKRESILAEEEHTLSESKQVHENDLAAFEAAQDTFKKMRDMTLEDIGKRSLEVSERESAVGIKEKSLISMIKEHDTYVAEQHKFIIDRHQALERAWKELEKKQNANK